MHPLELARVRSGNTTQLSITIVYSRHHYCLNNRLSIFKGKISFNAPNIMQMVKSRLTSLADGGLHAQMVVEPRP